MGEEVKKSAEENKPAAEESKKEPEKAAEEPKKEEEKSAEVAAPPPPPPEIVLRVFMHCEGCARKVRRCLKGFEGVEEVITDCRSSKVVVKGEKADPVKVLERVQRKSHRQVELLSPIPKPPPEEDANKTAEKEIVKVEEKTEEPVVITVVLAVYMHCEACAQEIKKRIQRMKGVESVEPELKSSQVTVKGVFEPEKLADYVYKRTGKHASIIKVEPEKKPDEEKPKEEKKPEETNKDEAKEGEKEPKKAEEAAGEAAPPAKEDSGAGAGDGGEDNTKLEVRKNDFYYYQPQNNYQMYHQRFIQEMNAYPPQMFSDENPNACAVM